MGASYVRAVWMKPLTQLAVMNDVEKHETKKISRRTRDGLERG